MKTKIFPLILFVSLFCVNILSAPLVDDRTYLNVNYINQTIIYQTIANGSDVFVYRAGDNMTGSLSSTPTGTHSLGSVISRWLKGWFVNIDVSGSANMSSVNITNNLVVNGNFSAKRPYAVFTDNTTQPATLANTAYIMNFSITEDNYLIRMIGNQNITAQQTGDYLFEVSPLFICTGGTPTVIDMWWQKNNVNVVRSNTRIYIPNNNQDVSMTIPFIIDLNQTDSLRIMWQASKTTCSIYWVAAGTNQPETPSVIMTITKISEITE